MNSLKPAITQLIANCPVAVALVFTSCSSTPQPAPPQASTPPPVISSPSSAAVPKAKPAATGVINIEAAWADVTVQSINYDTRHVKLLRTDGAMFDCKVGPLAMNFDKVKVGDQLRITMAEECVTLIGRGEAKPAAEADAAIIRVLVDGVPSGMAAVTTDVRAKILDVDLVARRIVAEVQKGDARSLKVAKNVDLTGLSPGDMIWVRLTEALAIKIERPQ